MSTPSLNPSIYIVTHPSYICRVSILMSKVKVPHSISDKADMADINFKHACCSFLQIPCVTHWYACFLMLSRAFWPLSLSYVANLKVLVCWADLDTTSLIRGGQFLVRVNVFPDRNMSLRLRSKIKELKFSKMFVQISQLNDAEEYNKMSSMTNFPLGHAPFLRN